MSLKSFHLLFITLAAMLCYGFCLWAFWAPDAASGAVMKAVGVLTGASGIALTAYGMWFRRKSRSLIV